LLFLVRRYWSPGLVTLGEVQKIREADERLKAERKISEYHSLPLHNDRIRAATMAYGQDPSLANGQKLSDESSVSWQDLHIIQKHSADRQLAIAKEAFMPLEPGIYDRFATFLENDASTMAAAHAEVYAAFGAALGTDPLIAELGRIAKLYRKQIENLAAGLGFGDDTPPLLSAILQVAGEQQAQSAPANS
jgi:hypothetical protein